MAQTFLGIAMTLVIVSATCLVFLGIVDLVHEAIQNRREDK